MHWEEEWEAQNHFLQVKLHSLSFSLCTKIRWSGYGLVCLSGVLNEMFKEWSVSLDVMEQHKLTCPQKWAGEHHSGK